MRLCQQSCARPRSQIIADARFTAVDTLLAAHAPWLQGLLFAGLFADVSPNWYRLVGSKLFTALVVQCGVGLLRSAATLATAQLARRRAGSCLCQPDMNRRALVANDCAVRLPGWRAVNGVGVQ